MCPCADEGAGEAVCVAVDDAGALAAVSHVDKVVRVYDARTVALVGRCAGHGDAATCVAFTAGGWSPAGGALVSGGADGTICVWRLPAAYANRAHPPAAAKQRAVLVGTDAGALKLRPVDVNDRYGAPVLKTPSGTRPGLCLDVSDGGATEDRATAVSAKEATHAVEDDATRADELNASGSSSVPSLAPFEELPRWAAAGVQQHERERVKRETEKLANLAKVAAGSKWAANAPGGCAPKLEGLSASVLDHGDVDVRVDDDGDDFDDDDDDRPDKENEPSHDRRQADEDDSDTGRRAPSVVSLKPLDDDDDALYYAESEPGGAGAERSAPDAFGVVTTSPRREGFSGGSDVAARMKPSMKRSSRRPRRRVMRRTRNPRRTAPPGPRGFSRASPRCWAGGRNLQATSARSAREAEKPLQMPCAEPPRSESRPSAGTGSRYPRTTPRRRRRIRRNSNRRKPNRQTTKNPRAVRAAFRLGGRGRREDPTRRNPNPNPKPANAGALRDSFSGRWRRRAKREPLPVHELIGGGDGPAAIDAVGRDGD